MNQFRAHPLIQILLVLTFFNVCADSNVREAQSYFETKNYEKSIELYEKLSKDPALSTWQQAAAKVNVGVSLTEQGKWEEGLKTLQQIRSTSPLVLRQIHILNAFIYLHLSESQEDKVKVLNQALSEIEEASKADCLFQKKEGRSNCQSWEELSLLKNSIERERRKYTDVEFSSNEPMETQIYMEIANQWMNRAQRIGEHKEDPMDILKYAIEDQEHALSINKLYIQLLNPGKEIKSWIINAQQETLNTANLFYPSVLDKESKDYPPHCQCHPWDNVIPSFEEGYKRAKWNLPIVSLQEDILRYWKESLENDTKKEDAAESDPESKNSSKMNDVLRELQGMDQDDQIPKEKKQVLQEGVRPW
jgi:tetratricopeptide (TPR) repeat protein